MPKTQREGVNKIIILIAENVLQGHEHARRNKLKNYKLVTPRNYRTAGRGVNNADRIICVGNPRISEDMAITLHFCFTKAEPAKRDAAIKWLNSNANWGR